MANVLTMLTHERYIETRRQINQDRMISQRPFSIQILAAVKNSQNYI